jgi:hypothetical protein
MPVNLLGSPMSCGGRQRAAVVALLMRADGESILHRAQPVVRLVSRSPIELQRIIGSSSELPSERPSLANVTLESYSCGFDRRTRIPLSSLLGAHVAVISASTALVAMAAFSLRSSKRHAPNTELGSESPLVIKMTLTVTGALGGTVTKALMT